MSWKATMDAHQVRQLKSALGCFSKIGSEVMLEARAGKLIIRTLNTTRSAFASITFHSSFFESHTVYDSSVIKGSVLIKHALALFRTQRIMKLMLKLDMMTQDLTAIIISESGIEKEFKIPCMESEVLEAHVDPNFLPTYVIASAKELTKLLSSFESNLEEITVIALPEAMIGPSSNAVQLHSYVDPSKKKVDESVQTHLSVKTTNVFINYHHSSDEPADVTINLRDFRVMLGWCLNMEMDMAIRFKGPGHPLLMEPFCPQGEMVEVEGQLVLASLFESQAHRAAARRQPGTAGPTGLKGRFRSPSDFRSTGSPVTDGSPAAPRSRPARRQSSGGVKSRQHSSSPSTAASKDPRSSVRPPKRSRFAPERQRQPSFESPYKDSGATPDLEPQSVGDEVKDHADPTPQPNIAKGGGAERTFEATGSAGTAGNEITENGDPNSFGSNSFDGDTDPAAEISMSDGQRHWRSETFEDDDIEDELPSGPKLEELFGVRRLRLSEEDDEEDEEDSEEEEDVVPDTPPD